MKDEFDTIWKELSGPTRRAILDRLRGGPQSTSQLVEAFLEMSRFGVMKHLDQLKQCRLVVVRKQDRFRYNSLNAVPLRQIYDHWASTLLSVKTPAEKKYQE